jgi:hypothetical protein
MRFSIIENAISTSESFINSLDSENITHREVQTHIVSGLIMLIISEYELHFESLFNQRANRCGDSYVCNYIKKSLNRNFRSPDIGKINETLLRFDTTYKEILIDYQNTNPQVKSAWDSLMRARHYIVHKQGNQQITFTELKEYYALSKSMIDTVEKILAS